MVCMWVTHVCMRVTHVCMRVTHGVYAHINGMPIDSLCSDQNHLWKWIEIDLDRIQFGSIHV